MEQLLEDFWEIIGVGNLIYWYIWSTSKTEKSLSLFPLVSNRSGHQYRLKDLQKPSIQAWEVELEIVWKPLLFFSLFLVIKWLHGGSNTAVTGSLKFWRKDTLLFH